MSATGAEPGAALVHQLLSETREELNRADTKVSMLFAVFGIAFGAALAGIIGGDWHPSDLAAGWEAVWWSGTALAIAALAALLLVIWPVLAHEHADGVVTYFMHVTDYKTPEQLRRAIERQAAHETSRELEQLRATAALARRKYRGVQWAIALYAAGAALAALAALAG